MNKYSSYRLLLYDDTHFPRFLHLGNECLPCVWRKCLQTHVNTSMLESSVGLSYDSCCRLERFP